MNHIKLKFYYEHVLTHVYSEGDAPFHRALTRDAVSKFVDPMQLPHQARILDLGCGPGYFLDEMKTRGYTNVLGLTLSPEDIEICQKNGHQVRQADMNFLPDLDESVDMIWARHSLEHSPFPYITLLEYNRVLRPGGRMYVEVPQPDCEREHEHNANHYSVLGLKMWLSLLARAGFDVEWQDVTVPVSFDEEKTWTQEKIYAFVCTRRRAVDVK
jgi:SAM-dependent methyltransferase